MGTLLWGKLLNRKHHTTTIVLGLKQSRKCITIAIFSLVLNQKVHECYSNGGMQMKK